MKRTIALLVSLLIMLSSLCQVAAHAEVQLSVGDTILFGHYPQSEYGRDNTPVKWIVLDVKDGKALIISKYVLYYIPFNKKSGSTSWSSCSLRKWMNGDFLNKAFTKDEQSIIIETDVDNSKSQGYYGTSSEKNTRDKVFALSYQEAHEYLGVQIISNRTYSLAARAAATEYALSRYPMVRNWHDKTADREPSYYWWLRSPGETRRDAMVVNTLGDAYSYTATGVSPFARPALWLMLDSELSDTYIVIPTEE